MLVLDATQWAALWYVGGMVSGAYSVWDEESITGAFNFGHGTQVDFERHKKANSALHLFMEV